MSLLTGTRRAMLTSGGIRSPSELPGVQAWLEPVDLVLNASDPVASWASRVGSVTFAQAVGLKQPLYQVASINGRNSVLFDGVAQDLTSGAIAGLDNTPNLTVIAVVRAPTFIASSRICSFSWAAGFGASSSDGAGLFYNSATAPQGYMRTAAAVFNGAPGGTITANTWHVQAFTNDGGASGPIAYLDGVKQSQSNAASGTGTTHVTIALGSLASGLANFCNVNLAELVICNAALSPSVMAALHSNYFKPKFAL